MNNVDVKINMPTSYLKSKADKALQAIKPKMKQRVIKDCNANVPFKTGLLRKSAVRWAPLLNDYIKWDTPYAHFQYTGRVMIGENSHSPFARRYEKKIYTNRSLTYRQGGAKWVDKTFSQKISSWIRLGNSLFRKEYFK